METMIVFFVAVAFGFVCGVTTTAHMFNRSAILSKCIKEEIDELHKGNKA